MNTTELSEVQEWLESQAYVSGLDETECSNLLREWFKHDGLHYRMLQKLKLKDDDSNRKEHAEKFELLDSLIGEIEDILRERLFEYANELEKSREKVQQFVVGLGIGHCLRSGGVKNPNI